MFGLQGALLKHAIFTFVLHLKMGLLLVSPILRPQLDFHYKTSTNIYICIYICHALTTNLTPSRHKSVTLVKQRRPPDAPMTVGATTTVYINK